MRSAVPLLLVAVAVACGAPAQEKPSTPPTATATPAEPPASVPTASIVPATAAAPAPTLTTSTTPPPPPPGTAAPPPSPSAKPLSQMTKEERAAALAAEADRLQRQMAALGRGGVLHSTDVQAVNVTPKAGGPKADAQISGVTATVPVPDADRVVAGLLPRFRDCYQTALNSDPRKVGQGKVVMEAQIWMSGGVQWALPGSGSYAGGAEMSNCLVSHVMGATFKSPGANGSKLTIQITFTATK